MTVTGHSPKAHTSVKWCNSDETVEIFVTETDESQNTPPGDNANEPTRKPGRRIYHELKSFMTSENHYSLIMIANMNGLDPFYYLAYVFKQLPAAKTVEDVEALPPWKLDNEKLKTAFYFGKGVVC